MYSDRILIRILFFVYILNKLAYIHISLNFTFIDLAGVI